MGVKLQEVFVPRNLETILSIYLLILIKKKYIYIYSFLGFIYRNTKDFQPTNLFALLYKSLNRPKFTFCKYMSFILFNLNSSG